MLDPNKLGLRLPPPPAETPAPVAPEVRYCLSDLCCYGELQVTRVKGQANLWQVNRASGGATYNVSAVRPICPFCGSELLTTANMIENVPGPNGAAHLDGPLADFLMTLL